MVGPSPADRAPGPKASPPAAGGMRDAPSAPVPSSPPADGHVDLHHGAVLLLPHRQQVVHVGHQHIEEGHGEGQDQQDGFLLLLAATPSFVVLLNLVSRGQAEHVAGDSPVPLGRSANTSARRGAARGCSSLPPQHPGPVTPEKEIPQRGPDSPRACAPRSSAQPARSPAPCPARGPRPGAAQPSAPGAARGSGSGSGSAALRAAPAREQCQRCRARAGAGSGARVCLAVLNWDAAG